MDNMSLADIAAVTGNGEFGGANAFVLIILFAMIFGGGFFGNRDGYGQYATAASQQEILFGQHFQNLDNKADRLGNGISDATFALNNSIKDGNASVSGAVVAEGRAIAERMADLSAAVHAEGEATRNMIQQNKIDTLQSQVNELKTQNMFCGIPRINPYGYGVYPYQQTGCGCNANI